MIKNFENNYVLCKKNQNEIGSEFNFATNLNVKLNLSVVIMTS